MLAIDTIFSRVINALDKDSNNNERVEATKRCLFGKPDLGETQMLLKEQIENDKRRFRERFGIDVENIENVCENVRKECDASGKKGRAKRVAKRKAGERQALRSHNKQLKMTGGYRDQ